MLTAETIVDATYPEEIRISPDGSMVAFTVVPVGQKGEHPDSAVWVARVGEAASARKLTAGTAKDHSPRWAPDGSVLYFLSDREKCGKAQLYRIRPDGGEAEALTQWEPGIDSPVAMPDGKTVAFLAADPESEEEKKRKEERDDAEVYGERWPRQRLRLLDLASREVTTVEALSERHIAEAVSSADGARLALVAARTPELDAVLARPEIVVVAMDGHAVTSVCHPASGAWQLAWGPEGREILFVATVSPGLCSGHAVFAVDAAGGSARQVSPALEACPVEMVASHDGVPYVVMQQNLDSWIGRLDLDARRLERLRDLPGNAWSLSVSDDGETAAVGRSTRDGFDNVWAGPAAELQRLTDLNPDLPSMPWGAQEPLSWQAPDGLTIEGLLILPVGATRADGPFSLMTLVHGGPYWRYSDELQLGAMQWGQWLAAAGYAVLLPNPRGGSGRGNDFADRVAGAIGQEDWADVASGIDHLIAEGIADPERLGIGGWSQGGYMTAWAVGQTRRFKAGIMGAGISDMGMMTATGDLPNFETTLAGSAPWDGVGPHRHDAVSPISFASTVTTPVLILHGAEDERVPVSQGRFFAQALREHGVPNELVVYPREPHGIRERNHQLDMLRRVRSWVERWLGPGWQAGR